MSGTVKIDGKANDMAKSISTIQVRNNLLSGGGVCGTGRISLRYLELRIYFSYSKQETLFLLGCSICQGHFGVNQIHRKWKDSL